MLQRVLGAALRTGGEFAEVYAEDKRSSSARLDDGKVEQVTSGRDRGAGVRVVAGETTGYAHTADRREAGLLAAAEAASAAARARRRRRQRGRPQPPHACGRSTPSSVYPETIAKATKVELLLRADDAARAAGSAIVQVSAGYGDSRKRILVANSDGLLAEDDQVRTLFRVSVVAPGDAGMQTGYESLGHTIGFELFDRYDVEDLARAGRPAGPHQARRPPGAVGLAAGRDQGRQRRRAVPRGVRPRPRGRPGRPRARRCSRAGSASRWRRRWSRWSTTAPWPASGAPSPSTTRAIPAQRNVLIQDGVLTDYMWDFLRSRKEGRAQSGNGRRQSYQHLPMVRMTNTFVLNGAEDPDDIIKATDHGVYVAQLGGGQVNTATGDFVFGMTEAYMIEDGELGDPIREGNLIGNGPQVLQDIDLLGNDFAMGNPGTCGKDGQGVPVGDGQPTLRVKALTIGGTAA